MILKPGLAISLAGNVMLVALVAWLLSGRAPEPVPLASGVNAPAVPASASAPAPAARVDDEKVLALARLEAASAPLPMADFWKADADQDAMRQMDAFESQRERMRADLVRRYGSGAAEDPAFARLFRPLNARFPYLSSKSQLALVKLQRMRPPPVAGMPGMIRAGQSLPDLSAFDQQQLAYERNVRAALTPAEWQEYQLRESSTARQLRASGATASEQQFREVFAVLQRLDQERTPSSYVDAQEKLQALLGASRYAKFSAAHDPAYAALQVAAARHQLTTQQLDGVYSAVLGANNKLARLSMNPAAQERTAPDAATLQVLDQRYAEVTRLVGDEAATDLIDAYMNQLMTNVPRQNAML